MRKILETELGQLPISEIKIDLKSRDDIPKILLGLQAIYCDDKTRNKIFEILQKALPQNINPHTGRKGMDLWKIFVLGSIRLGCSYDFDRLHDIANNHRTIRQMLGHGTFSDDYEYKMQTLKDNISLFTPEVLEEINNVVVEYGHNFFFGQKKEKELNLNCDSFVTETDVHFPTDISLLFDSLRKAITLIMNLCLDCNLTDWRQGKYNLKKVKKLARKAQKLKHSTSKNPEKKAKRQKLIENAYKEYIDFSKVILQKAEKSLSSILVEDIMIAAKMEVIKNYMNYAEKFIDQIDRRVMNGEKIPHEEKIFSIFQEHTEWIKKGKAGVPQQLGLRVCVLKDQFGFIVHHRIMEQETDDKVAIPIIFAAKQKFDNIKSCSFDKGFYTPNNQKELSKMLDNVILPQKGKLSQKRSEIENSDDFQEFRRKHSSVEASISALQNQGLKKCRDHGIKGFKRYISLGVIARNLQILGQGLQQKELRRQKKRAAA